MPFAPVGGSTIDVDSDVFGAAGSAFLRANASLADAVTAASSAAGEGHGMAGAFSDGVDWATDYDLAAATAMTAAASLVDAAGRLGELLGLTGANHAAAEQASVPGASTDALTVTDAGTGRSAVSVIVPAPPGASGAPADPPAGWFLVSHLLSVAWPDGDQGRLRGVAQGWRTAAEAFEADADALSGPIGELSAQRSPEVTTAVDRCCQVQLSARGLSEGFAQLGGSCEELAQHIDDAHAEIVQELEMLLAQEVVMQVAGAALAVFTAGVSEVAAQAASAARIALAASRIGTAVARLGELIRTAVTAIRVVGTRLGEIVRDLRGVLTLGDDTAGVAFAGAYGPTTRAVVHSVGAAGGSAVRSGALRGLLRGANGVLRADLRAAEHAGGHTIREHVAKSDAYLVSRVKKRLASTFADLTSAEECTAANIAANMDKVEQWLKGSSSILPIAGPLPAGVGRTYIRASNSFVESTRMTTVLVRTRTGYRVHTSFPEP